MFDDAGKFVKFVVFATLPFLVVGMLVGPAVSPSLPAPVLPQRAGPTSVTECGATRGARFYTVRENEPSELCSQGYQLARLGVQHLGMAPHRPRWCDASWLVEEATLCTRDGTRIVGLAYQGDLEIGGVVGESYDVLDPRWNCHGDTFAGGFFAINPDQVDAILASEFVRVDSRMLQPGDIVVYRTAAGVPIHSSTLYMDSSDGQLKTYGKRGVAPMSGEVMRPIGPGPGAAWGNAFEEPAAAELYRRKP